MKSEYANTRTFAFAALFLLLIGTGSFMSMAANQNKSPSPFLEEEITQFVRRIFQDRNGNLWLGTNGDGAIRFNGGYLEYFSKDQGFPGHAVRGIIEDEDGNLWFGTNRGLTKYDISTGATFTNFTVKDGLVHDDIWSLTFDQSGTMWIGTYGGVSQFDGENFTSFALPETQPDPTRGVTSPTIVHCIMEDSKGRMWFATNGGVFVYDSEEELINISEKDGLSNNVVNCILEDKAGDFWFATHHGGVCRLSPEEGKELQNGRFISFTAEHGIQGVEVWDLYSDKEGNIWFPVEGSGVYRYNFSDGLKIKEEKVFTHFGEAEGLSSNAIQCTFEDKDGTIWFGGWMGLFSYNAEGWPEQGGKLIRRHTKMGPWD